MSLKIYKTNFGDIPEEYSSPEKASIVILPVPYDGTSTWGKGADRGPQAIIAASANLEWYDLETNSEVYKKGIFTAEPITENSSPEKMTEAVQKKIQDCLKKGLFTVTIGGEHSISIGAIKSHAQHFQDISVLQLDAHADLREEYHDSKYNHACVMARAKEVADIVQVGIRSLDYSEKKNLPENKVFFAEKIRSDPHWQDKVVSALKDKVYLTIDLDVFDPAYLPATGTPEPGGLGWYEILSLLKKIAQEKKIVGFDVVELAPQKNHHASDFLAAKLIYKLLSYIFEPKY